MRHAPAHVITDHEDGGDAEMEEMRLAVGRRDGVRAGDLVRMIADALKIQKRAIGRVHVRDRITLVNLRAEHLEAALVALRDARWSDRPMMPERGRGAGGEAQASVEPGVEATTDAGDASSEALAPAEGDAPPIDASDGAPQPEET